MAFRQRKRLRNTVLAAALGLFLAGGIKAGAEEIKIEKKAESFSLETSLAIDNIGEVNDLGQAIPNVDLNVYGEYNFDEGYKILGDFEMENTSPRKIILAAGHPHAYLGVKWENLSGETSLLEDANLFKLETGIRDIADFLNLSSFVAYTSIPNMKIGWGRDTPLQLYTFGVDTKIKPKFGLKNNSVITPWFSGKILLNGILAQNTEHLGGDYDDSSFAWAFNHLNVGLGVDFSTKHFDFGLENYLDGNYYPFMAGTEHRAKINIHDKDKRNFLEYAFILNPQFNWLGWPANWYLQSDINFRIHFSPEIYLKGIANINHSTVENPNLIAALGYLNKDGTNIELFCNLQNKIIGITLSNRNLGNKLERYSKEPYKELARSDADEYSYTTIPDLNEDKVIDSEERAKAILNDYGPNIADVIDEVRTGDYVSTMKNISKYASYFAWVDHEGIYTAEQEHDLGKGVCRDTNGVLLPTVINGVLGDKGYKSWGKTLFGPYVGHAITIIKKPNRKYDVMDYSNIYYLDAKTEQEAIDSVYPGAYAYDGGTYSETSQRVINALEESVWK